MVMRVHDRLSRCGAHVNADSLSVRAPFLLQVMLHLAEQRHGSLNFHVRQLEEIRHMPPRMINICPGDSGNASATAKA
jgi:hypothetical protein